MHEQFLQRCCDLALLPGAEVSPNPRVGAVLVYNNSIIGEGYHKRHGSAHAEVNCLASVKPEDRHLISQSTIYVSLEPCCIFGRTPPCTDLIIKNKIPKVIVSQLDKTAEVSGRGLQLLRQAGIEVTEFPHFEPAARVVKPRQLFTNQHRPFVLLKYARSSDGFLAPRHQEKYWITGPISRRLVHFWRTRTNAILIGAGTLLADDPQLNLRYYTGQTPVAIVVDPKAKVSDTSHRLFQQQGGEPPVLIQPIGSPLIPGIQQHFIIFPTVYSSSNAPDGSQSSKAVDKTAATQLCEHLLDYLHSRNFNHITVEGGSWLLKNFLTSKLWDEARVFTASHLVYGQGVKAPLPVGRLQQSLNIQEDLLQQFYPD